MSANLIYIMSPQLFTQLCNVHGFCAVNGTTYAQHVALVTGCDSITSANDSDAVFKMLAELGIKFTHDFDAARMKSFS